MVVGAADASAARRLTWVGGRDISVT